MIPRSASLAPVLLPALLLAVPALAQQLPAEPAPGAAGQEERFSLHYQATVATQAHPAFSAAYSGLNSLRPGSESATSIVTDLFAGVRLWRGAELQVQPELAGGRGLSSTLGVAAFPSGEVYRVGDPEPTLVVGKAFLRQTIGLGGGRVRLESGQGQLAGERDRDALTLTAGKVSTNDIFDGVPLSRDPHTGFMSWGLWASGAYDYPADTRGYTWGVAADLSVDWWSIRTGAFLEPKTANGMDMEWDVSKARGLVAEGEARYSIAGLPGAARLLVFLDTADMGSYQRALEASPSAPDVTRARATGRTKGGVAASANQDLGGGLGIFVRASWSDGQNETWAFTEIDRSAAVGLVQSGARWGRPDDEAGLGVVVSGLSDVHRRYLAAGGYGFIIGDGALRYAPEVLGEAYYRLALTREVSLGANYQPIVDPAFNADRGPVHVFTGRVHVAF
ncbi:MAG TPA: carbohydrate porin [Anaeromyxobacteraceae bacterium]|jgi:high affinity Mn2+ porin|nr:carbohydrate porin [Anaeromyxobacteraceae bacterium]